MRKNGKHAHPNIFFAKGDLTPSNNTKHIALSARRNQLRSTISVVLASVISEGLLAIRSAQGLSQRRGGCFTGTRDDLASLLHSKCHTAAAIMVYCCSTEGLFVELVFVGVLK
jgi:hypothetical protein